MKMCEVPLPWVLLLLQIDPGNEGSTDLYLCVKKKEVKRPPPSLIEAVGFLYNILSHSVKCKGKPILLRTWPLSPPPCLHGWYVVHG